MNNSELELIEKWKSDPSFVNWVHRENEADVRKWNSFFDQNPQYVEIAEVAKFSMEIRPKEMTSDKKKSLDALAKLRNKIPTQSYKTKPTIKKIPFSKLSRIAASLLILVACYWGYSSLTNTGKEIVYATQEDQKEIYLSDGTKVILNAYSSLTYLEKEVRKVSLEGEAYFEVAKKPESGALFQVETKDLTVTVLGTEFNVNSEDGQTSVYLDEGKVKLNLGNAEHSEIQMQPGELVSYSKTKDQVLENRKANSLEKTAWKEKVILFQDAPLSDVLKTVSMVYGVKFDSDFSAEKDQLFTGGIPTNDLIITLKTLQDIYQLDINKNEEIYLIKKRD